MVRMALNDMIAVMLGLALESPISISGEPVPLRSGWIYSWRPGLAIADINRHLAQQAATEDEIISHLGILCNQMTMR